MEVTDKLVEVLDKAVYIADITKAIQDHENPRIAYGIEEYTDDIEIYGVKIRKDAISLDKNQKNSGAYPVLEAFYGDAVVSTVEDFILTFENIKFDEASADDVVSIASLKLHRLKTFKKVKMTLEFRGYPILESENIEEANRVYMKMNERKAYLDQIKIKQLRDEFNAI